MNTRDKREAALAMMLTFAASLPSCSVLIYRSTLIGLAFILGGLARQQITNDSDHTRPITSPG